jgi:hypothetical protein
MQLERLVKEGSLVLHNQKYSHHKLVTVRRLRQDNSYTLHLVHNIGSFKQNKLKP